MGVVGDDVFVCGIEGQQQYCGEYICVIVIGGVVEGCGVWSVCDYVQGDDQLWCCVFDYVLVYQFYCFMCEGRMFLIY